MTEKRTRIRVKPIDGGGAEVYVLVSHPMETGLRTNPQTREKVPAHFIQKLTFFLNGKEVAVADTGTGVSTNPLVSIRLPAAKRGDKVRVSWTDNFGQKDEEEITIGDGG
jgi:sulfur-oxidizing protein SoxZ